MNKIVTVYEVTLNTPSSTSLTTSKRVEVIGAGQSAAIAVNKKFKDNILKKILLGFQINEQFISLNLKSV